MLTAYFCKVKEFFARSYHQRIRVNGEQAMDNLMGTMIGVLFLAVISASFAGVYMAYSVSSAKATENTERINLASKYSTNTLSKLYAESATGGTSAQANGWTVVRSNTALNASPTLSPSTSFTDYTYAATRPLVPGGTGGVLVSQWGKVTNGLVTLYTAIPKAGSDASKCNWTEPADKIEYYCNMTVDTVQSVINPPVGVEDQTKVLWEQEINEYPWTNAPYDWTSDIKRDVTTSKLGDFTPAGQQDFKWVAMFDNLQPGKKVTIDFVESTNSTIYTHSFTPTLEPGETGNVSRSAHGTLSIPAGVTTVTAYIDTDVASTTGDPTVKLSRFIVYTKK